MATWCGWAPAPSDRATDGSCSRFATRRRSSSRPRATDRRRRFTRPSSSISVRWVPRSRPEILGAAGNQPEAEVVAALWDLVWAGAITNDSLAALRSQLGRAHGEIPSTARTATSIELAPHRSTGGGRPLVAGALTIVWRRTDVACARATAQQLLERYGVVTREAVRSEGVVGGYAAVYPVLRALEERGRGPTRLLRQRPRRGPVRTPAARSTASGPTGPRTRTPNHASSPPPTRPSRTAPRCRGPAWPVGVRRVPPARSS